jgi:hypothetical protein
LFQSLRLQQLSLLFQLDNARVEFLADRRHRAQQLFVRRHELFRRIQRDHRQLLMHMPRQRLEARDAIDLVAEELDANSFLVEVCRLHFHHIAAHAKSTALKRDVVPFVKHLHQLRQHALARNRLPDFQREQHVHVILRRTQTVDARHTRDHDHILRERSDEVVDSRSLSISSLMLESFSM